MIPRGYKYRFNKATQKASKTIADFSVGMNTNAPETDVVIRSAKNVIFNAGSGFETRPGTLQKGSPVNGTTQVKGLHSYIKKDGTAQLLASSGTGIYTYSDIVTPSAIATSTATNPLSYSKDRTVFVTSAVDAAGEPYVVVIYHTGSAIVLEYSATPYSSWAVAPVTIVSTTTQEFSAVIDEDDNIFVAYIDNTTGRIGIKKMTYAAGPAWTSSSITISSGTYTTTGTHYAPTIAYLKKSGATRSDAAVFYCHFDGATTYRAIGIYSVTSPSTSFQYRSSTVNSATYTNRVSPLAVNATNYLTADNYTCYVAVQDATAKSYKTYSYDMYKPTIATLLNTLTGYTTCTIGEFTAYNTATGISVVNDTAGLGYQVTNISTAGGGTRTDFTVAVDGATDRDIQSTQTIAGSIQSATRLTSGSANNIHPRSPEVFTSNTTYIPVVFRTGTASPYTININSFVNWTSTGTTLTTGYDVNSCTMPLTAAGGTNQHYFVNGVNTPRKWDGSTMTVATATSMPTPSFIFAMDNRLLMDDVTTGALFYTNLGSDNFTGTFPTTNRVDFPEKPVWGHFYRDRQALIFTNSGVYIMNNFDYTGAVVAAEALRKIPDSYGTLSGRTVKQVGYWVYYQRPDGQVMRTNGQYAELVSDPIYHTLQTLNTAQLLYATAGVKDQQYFLSVTESANAQNNLRFRLDTRKAPNGGWSYDTGIYCGVFAEHVNNTKNPTLFFADARTTVSKVYEVDRGQNDYGSAIDADLQTGLMPLSGIIYKDRLRNILVVAKALGNYDPTLGIAKLETSTLFLNKSFSVDPDSPIWGAFTWGSFTWGGKSYVERNILNVNLISRAFKIRIRHNVLNEPISITSISLDYEQVTDTP